MAMSHLNNGATPVTFRRLSDQPPVECLEGTFCLPGRGGFECHYPLEVGIMLEGRLRYVFGDGEIVVGPGEFWLCAMWEPHSKSTVEEPIHTAVLMIDPPLLAETRFEEAPTHDWLLPFRVPLRDRPQVHSDQEREEMLSLARRILAARKGPEDLQKVRYRLLAWETMLAVTRKWSPPPCRPMVVSEDWARVKRATDMILASTGRLSVQEVSRQCGLSERHLSTLFRDATGVSFTIFALRYRLSQAAHQLICTTQPVKAIAARWGFANPSHFHRTFQRQYGLSPTQYRRRICLENDETRGH